MAWSLVHYKLGKAGRMKKLVDMKDAFLKGHKTEEIESRDGES